MIAKKTELQKSIPTVLPWIWFALMFVIYVVYLNAHATQHLDADMSSEMVLSHLLSEEDALYNSGQYIVFGYDNYELMAGDLAE